MNSGVRIIKRSRKEISQSLPPGQGEKTARQNERDIASTIKGWIAEWEQRQQASARSPFARFK